MFLAAFILILAKSGVLVIFTNILFYLSIMWGVLFWIVFNILIIFFIRLNSWGFNFLLYRGLSNIFMRILAILSFCTLTLLILKTLIFWIFSFISGGLSFKWLYRFLSNYFMRILAILSFCTLTLLKLKTLIFWISSFIRGGFSF